ncbi:MAG: competence/damage-inducible protein A [Deltaproteobacteria bacterium]|nr:competence/damage-inducible protein A [Deltaproteobacteria bacterium]
MRVEIITIGNEVISGHTADTNAALLSHAVFSQGAEITRVVSVGDEVETIVEALHEAIARADLILVTGGLGPTPDDRTAEAAARALGKKLTLHKEYLEILKERFRKWHLTFTPSDEKVAYIPEGAVPLPNPVGMCGFRLDEGSKNIFFFPGVPREVKELVQEALIPFLRAKIRGGKEIVRSALLKVFGPTESGIKEILHGIQDDIELAYLPSFPEIHLRVVARGVEAKEVEARLKRCEDEIAERLGVYLFGTGDEVMEGVAGRLLREKKSTIAVAESCTGGLIAHRITEVSGSSAYFLQGVVAYSNQAKEQLLGVSQSTLERFGPVSKEIAHHMAQGVREGSGATLGVATTGIAGPKGGTSITPVGRVFIALAAEDMVEVKKYDFFGDRHQVKLMASEVALDRVRRYLIGQSAYSKP